jgi:hypothetical protein
LAEASVPDFKIEDDSFLTGQPAGFKENIKTEGKRVFIRKGKGKLN